jgi:hypothetical protein
MNTPPSRKVPAGVPANTVLQELNRVTLSSERVKLDTERNLNKVNESAMT